jgi:hypothetical protein
MVRSACGPARASFLELSDAKLIVWDATLAHVAAVGRDRPLDTNNTALRCSSGLSRRAGSAKLTWEGRPQEYASLVDTEG